MIIATVLAGVIAYFISCKLRKKIILATVFIASISIVYMIILSNLIILDKGYGILEIFSLSLGAIGIYVLLLAVLLVPLSLIAWFISRLMRNLKERKEPLLMLEGRCDL